MTYATKFRTPSPVKRSKNVNAASKTQPSSGSMRSKRRSRYSRRKLGRDLEKAEVKRKKLPVQFQERLVSILEAKEQLKIPSIIPFQGILSDEDIKRIASKYISPESRNRVILQRFGRLKYAATLSPQAQLDFGKDRNFLDFN